MSETTPCVLYAANGYRIDATVERLDAHAILDADTPVECTPNGVVQEDGLNYAGESEMLWDSQEATRKDGEWQFQDMGEGKEWPASLVRAIPRNRFDGQPPDFIEEDLTKWPTIAGSGHDQSEAFRQALQVLEGADEDTREGIAFALDEWVADAKDAERAAINNSGAEEQIKYLLQTGVTANELLALLKNA